MKEALESLRSAVRPVVTLALVAGFIFAAFTNGPAADTLGPPTGIIVAWWFAERGKKP